MIRSIDVARLVAKAAKIYASAPSHAPLGATPDPGTYCAVYALAAAADAQHEPSYMMDRAYVEAIKAVEQAACDDLVCFNAVATTEEMLAVFAKAEAELCR